ncbi:MAG TPA: hypothetical protein VGJ64_06295 [Gemmatimonadaceae bacterium]
MTSDARPADVASPKAIVIAVYEIISGRAGEARDWDRWRTLYAPGARLIPIERDGEGRSAPRVLDPDEYIESRTPMLAANDFFEWETGHEELRSGSIVHVWSAYDAARTPGGEVIRRGVNSIQLWNDGSRWWILSEVWDAVNAEAVTGSG